MSKSARITSLTLCKVTHFSTIAQEIGGIKNMKKLIEYDCIRLFPQNEKNLNRRRNANCRFVLLVFLTKIM